MPEPSFPVSLRLRLDWSELDMFGHINNVSYFKYLQASRVHYWELIGLDALGGTTGIGPMLASTHCDFKKPLHYPGNITVVASIVSIGNSSFRIHHRILDDEDVCCAEGFDVVVLYDYEKGGKTPVRDELRAMIEALEGRSIPKT